VTRTVIPWALFAACVLASAYGCSGARYSGSEPTGPTLTFPARFAEGEPSDGGPMPVASASAAPSAAPRVRPTLPDPEPLRIARHWDYLVSYDAGKVRVVKVTERVFPKPAVTQRHLGRYAIELWIGHELLDRVRFDFPALAAEPIVSPGPRPLKETPSLAKAAVVAARVLVPASPRATRAVLVDRKTGMEQLLPWPPDAPLPPVVADTPSAEARDAAADSPN
jgi:hypothetical protein